MTAHVTAEQAEEIFRRVNSGERVNVVGIDFGLLDTEVREVVKRARTARAARTGAAPQPAPAVSPTPQQAPARPPATATSTASRIGRLLTTGSPVGGTSTVPEKRVTDVTQYLEHQDKKIAKAAAAAHKALTARGGLVFAWDAAEADRQRQERERAEAAAAVERLEQELAEARDKLRAARGITKSSTQPLAGESKKVRAWAAENGVVCPPVGRVPRNVQEAYDQAHSQEAHAS